MTTEEARQRIGGRVERMTESRPHTYEPLESGIIVDVKDGIVWILWDDELLSEPLRDVSWVRPLGGIKSFKKK